MRTCGPPAPELVHHWSTQSGHVDQNERRRKLLLFLLLRRCIRSGTAYWSTWSTKSHIEHAQEPEFFTPAAPPRFFSVCRGASPPGARWTKWTTAHLSSSPQTIYIWSTRTPVVDQVDHRG